MLTTTLIKYQKKNDTQKAIFIHGENNPQNGRFINAIQLLHTKIFDFLWE